MKLTKVQKMTRFIVYRLSEAFALGMVTGLIPVTILVQIYQILGL